MRRVAITGLGVVSALGIGVDPFWDGLKHGRSGTRRITLFDQSLVSVPIAAEVPDFDPELHLAGLSLDMLDRFSQLALVAGAKRSGCVSHPRRATRSRRRVDRHRRRRREHAGRPVSSLLRRENCARASVLDSADDEQRGRLAGRHDLRAARSEHLHLDRVCVGGTLDRRSVRNDSSRTRRRDDRRRRRRADHRAGHQGLGSDARARQPRRPGDRLPSLQPRSPGHRHRRRRGRADPRRVGPRRARGARILAELVGYGATSDAGHITQPGRRRAGTRDQDRARPGGPQPEQIST